MASSQQSTLLTALDDLIHLFTHLNFEGINTAENEIQIPDEISTFRVDIDNADDAKETNDSHSVSNVTTFYRRKHIDFILKLQTTEESYEYCQTEHLRMQVLYWALCGLDLCKSLHLLTDDGHTKEDILQFIEQCWLPDDGGFGGNLDHDVHLLNTLSAIQIVYLLGECKVLESKRDSIAQFIASLQTEDGAFMGDKWGEIDTRFTYAALNALSLIDRLDAIDTDQCKAYLMKCRNFDGGYGTKPGAESHSGMIFCCVASLAILDCYEAMDVDVLNWWLCERQVIKLRNLDQQKNTDPLWNGGLNGRPMKLPDVCYSWWCLSAMKICDRVRWINKGDLIQFILNAQDVDDGGISDRPGDMCDVYHTYFGIGGLSLLGCTKEYYLKAIDPIWALPCDLCRKIGLYDRHEYADIDYQHDVIHFADS